MTERESRRILKWFQKHIGLLGWEVAITIGKPPPELGADIPPGEGNRWYGRSQTFDQFHQATIWINPDAHKDTSATNGMAETLIHELLHCYWNLVGMEEGNSDQCEWANNQLAAVLVKQYRADTGRAGKKGKK